MPQNMPKDERTLFRTIANLTKRVASLETATRAGHTSISSGSLVVRDTDTGAVLASFAAGDNTDDDGNTIPAGVSANVGDIDGAVLRDGSVDESKVSFSISGGGITSTVGPTAPTTPPPNAGDLWVDTSHGNVVNRWDGTAWVALPVGTDAIQAGAITAAQIAANTVTAGQIAAGTLTAAQIAANTITAAKIAANTITASQIAANTITAGELAAGAVTAATIAVGAITAGKLAAGAIDGETITGATLIADGASGGMFIYSGTPAAGNLVVAIAPADGTDAFGNAYTQGLYVSGYMLGDTVNALVLQPKPATGTDFEPGEIFVRTDASLNSADMWITSPNNNNVGGSRSQIIMRGSDTQNPGVTSMVELGADTIRLDGNVVIPGPTQWTPTLSGLGSAVTNVRDGWYYRLGNLIIFNAYITFSAAGVSTNTTNVTMTLPVTPYRGTANRRQTYTGALTDGVQNPTGLNNPGQLGALACMTFAGSATGIDRILMSNGNNLQGGNIAAGSIITVQGVIREA